MLDIQKLTKTRHKIISIGSHGSILQSMLDFDYLSGKQEPDLIGIIATGKKFERLFWGKKDILIPVYTSIKKIPHTIADKVTLFFNVSSGRRTLASSIEIMEMLPNILGGCIFAENVPEKHAIDMYNKAQELNKFIVGPASVGILLPNKLKLGAIGGTQAKQLKESHLFEKGTVAVLSSSGGMVNEMIRLVTSQGKRISFSLAFGGDRFPGTTPKDVFLALEKYKATTHIVYFGELGGYDEYDLAQLLKEKKLTKQVIVYIAGTISEMFETPPQFGHAKAMASRGSETALAKRKILKQAGAKVADSFTDFIQMIKKIEHKDSLLINQDSKRDESLEDRKHALFVNSISTDIDGVAKILGKDISDMATDRSFAHIVMTMLLGKQVISKELESFTDLVLKLLVDHGPYVSGAVNTMITARAGKDMVSSLAAGLLTIGPRFGGAINEAASNWFTAVRSKEDPYVFVEKFAKQKRLIAGIGHRKYRIDQPDPRVNALLETKKKLRNARHTRFALDIQSITTSKKSSLILNVDGAIAALMLDLLFENEKYSTDELQELIETEFFNALFILSRSVGFVAHYLDQRRLDEGLFRLPTDEVVSV